MVPHAVQRPVQVEVDDTVRVLEFGLRGRRLGAADAGVVTA